MTNRCRSGLVAILAVFVATFVVAQPADAQCIAGAREFASIGGMMVERLRINTVWAQNAGEEIGRFWDAGNSADLNNFDGGCPSNDPGQTYGTWWSEEGDQVRGVRGFISGTGCQASSCTNGDLIVLVEDWGPKGPPGVDDSAWFVALRTPIDAPDGASHRRWDLALVDNPVWGGMSPTSVDMQEIPPLQLTSHAEHGPTTYLGFTIPDIAPGVSAVDVQGNSMPASNVVSALSIYFKRDTSPNPDEPGRDVLAWGDPIHQVPYDDGPSYGEVAVFDPCGEWEFGATSWLAVGLEFEGGAGDLVRGALVSRAVRVPCNVLFPVPAGTYPDGHLIPGEPLRLHREMGLDGPEISFSFGDSCNTDYVTFPVIYEGPLGHWRSLVPISGCGNQLADWVPGVGNTFYLVVPTSSPPCCLEGPGEGGYGAASVARPRSPAACVIPGYGFCSSP